MSWLRITNQGEIELGALALLGASTKEGNTSKIGFFGSGNKYAIATLLRLGVEFHIYSGLNEIPVETRQVSFGGQTFDQIILNGETTSFTTRMGPDWVLWYAIREFITNAIDEGGYALGKAEYPGAETCEGQTNIYIAGVPDVEDFISTMDEYVLDEPEVLHKASVGFFGQIQVLTAPSDRANIYRKGVCVMSKTDEKALWRYNIENLDISESRVYKYGWQVDEAIAGVIATFRDRAMIERYLANGTDEGYFEHDAAWDSYNGEMSAEWVEALKERRIIPTGALAFMPQEDAFGAWVVTDRLYSYLREHYPDLSFFNASGDWTEVEPTSELVEKVQRATDELRDLDLWRDLPIGYVIFKTKDVGACYTRNDNTVRVNVEMFVNLTHETICAILMEENDHARGYSDGSRLYENDLQTRLYKAKIELRRAQARLEGVKKALDSTAQ